MYEISCQLASFPPPMPDMRPLFGPIHGNQDAMDVLARVIARAMSRAEFIENVGRIFAAAGHGRMRLTHRHCRCKRAAECCDELRLHFGVGPHRDLHRDQNRQRGTTKPQQYVCEHSTTWRDPRQLH